MSRKAVDMRLKNWVKALDAQVGDTTEEIEKRRQQNANAVNIRRDISELIAYMNRNDLPDSVYRALEYCLKWNPFTKTE